jgi:hypothetical protein
MNGEQLQACEWVHNNRNLHNVWITDCGHRIDHTSVNSPTTDGFVWCPFCGRVIQEAYEDD